MTIVDVITVICICVLLVILLALMAFVLIDFLKSREGRRMVRTMKDVCSTIISCMSPSTPIQKEIRDEERAIKKLKKQKADMQRLEELKQEHEKIFEEERSKRHRLIDPKVWAELDSTIYENYKVMVDDVYKECARVERNDVWSESDESYGDICADPTTMPDSVSSPHECPSCHTEAMMHYPGFKGYDWFCHNCQYKYQYGRN